MLQESSVDWVRSFRKKRDLYDDFLAIRLPRFVLKQLKEEAKTKGLTLSDLMRGIIKEFLEEKTKKEV
jgi:predicted hydrocarbon binding protein